MWHLQDLYPATLYLTFRQRCAQQRKGENKKISIATVADVHLPAVYFIIVIVILMRWLFRVTGFKVVKFLVT